MMNESILYELLRSDGSIVINKRLARAIGLECAVLYSELISKYIYFQENEMLTEDGFFYNTADDMEKDTSLSKKQQTPIITKLVELNLVEYKDKRGVPPKRHFRLNPDLTVITSIIESVPKVTKSNFQKLQKVTYESDKKELSKVTKCHSNNTKEIILKKNTKEKDQKTEAKASASTSSLFPLPPRTTPPEKLTDEEISLQRLLGAEDSGDWKSITDTDFVQYFVHQHNKRFKEQIALPPKGQSRNTLVAIMRDGFIKKYNIKRSDVCEMIDRIQQAYLDLESRQEYKDRFELRLFDQERYINKLMNHISRHESYQSNEATTRISETDRKSIDRTF